MCRSMAGGWMFAAADPSTGASVLTLAHPRRRRTSPSGRGRSDRSAEIGNHRSVPREGPNVFSWRRWDRLHLVFSRDGQFVGVRLYRNAGITEQQADAALRQLGVTMEPNKYFAGAAERGYSDMSGPIRTVI